MTGKEATIRDALVAAIFTVPVSTRNKLILLSFAFDADIEGHTFLTSENEIARGTRYTLRTVRRGLDELETMGVLQPVATRNADVIGYILRLEHGPERVQFAEDDEAHTMQRAARWFAFMEGCEP